MNCSCSGVLTRADIQNIRSAGYIVLAGNFWHWQEACWELSFKTYAHSRYYDEKLILTGKDYVSLCLLGKYTGYQYFLVRAWPCTRARYASGNPGHMYTRWIRCAGLCNHVTQGLYLDSCQYGKQICFLHASDARSRPSQVHFLVESL